MDRNVALSRRDFLALGGVATTAVVASTLSGCGGSPITTDGDSNSTVDGGYAGGRILPSELEASVVETETISDFSQEKTFDVIVVGAGTSGIPAALAAFDQGAKVAVLQKDAAPVAQGMLAARVMKDMSTDPGMMAYMHELDALNAHRPKMYLLKAYVDHSQEALEWYEGKLSAAGFTACKESDSKDHIYDDGNCYIKGLLFPDGMQAPTTALADYGASQGIEFFYNTPAVQLVAEDGAVTGVVGKTGGEYIKFNAKSIILATGDYQNNDAMLGRYVPDALGFGRKQMNKTGDGQLMGMLAGATMEPGSPSKMIHGGKGCFRNEPFLAVNMEGKRFHSEDVSYGDRNTILRDQPDHKMVTLFDSDYTTQVYGWGSDPTVPTVANGTPDKIEKFVEDGTLLRADSIEELAKAAGLPEKETAASVTRYNELCAQGADLDFGKPSKFMQPVSKPPFYAMLRDYNVSAILGGLMIDENYQCLGTDGNPIAGLYAAGNCSGPFYGRYDYSLDTMGLSVGRAITFGYLTGKAAASF